MHNFFGHKVDPAEEAKKWKRNISREVRAIERSISDIDREEKKLIAEMKKLAKQGDARRGALSILAKDLVRSRNAKEKMLNGKVMLTSVQMQIQMQLSSVKVAGCIQKSSEVLKTMNSLIKIPELSRSCAEMAREMEKAGLIDDVISDAMEDTTDEGEVDAEVAKVLEELALNVSSAAPAEPTTRLAAPESQLSEEAKAEQAREEEELKQMKERLRAL